MQMVRWMCGTSLEHIIPSTELRNRLGINSIPNYMRCNLGGLDMWKELMRRIGSESVETSLSLV